MSDLLVEMHKRNILKTAERCYRTIQQLNGNKNFVPYGRIRESTRQEYIQLAIFIIKNKLPPQLYLRVMKEFTVNFYPRVLRGSTAIGKYREYTAKLYDRYKDLKSFTRPDDRSFNILRNDLYVVAGINPDIPADLFFTPLNSSRFYGYNTLLKNLETTLLLVHPATAEILKDLVRVKSVEKSKYYSQIKAAINVK